MSRVTETEWLKGPAGLLEGRITCSVCRPVPANHAALEGLTEVAAVAVVCDSSVQCSLSETKRKLRHHHFPFHLPSFIERQNGGLGTGAGARVRDIREVVAGVSQTPLHPASSLKPRHSCVSVTVSYFPFNLLFFFLSPLTLSWYFLVASRYRV